MADSWRTDGKVISSLTVLHWQGKFEILLTVLWPTGKAKSIPDVSRLSGEIFPDGRLKTDAVYLSWQFLPSVNSQWRFSVRETRLSATFFRWRLIPDGNRHRWPFLTVFGTFPDGRDRQEKNWAGVVGRQLRGNRYNGNDNGRIRSCEDHSSPHGDEGRSSLGAGRRSFSLGRLSSLIAV